MSPQVVTVKGEGGAVWDMDVPNPASMAGERFAAQLESGALTIVAGAAVELEPDEDVDQVPTGNAAAVLEWVDGDPDRAQQALAVETAKSKPRKGLVAALGPIAEPEPEADDPDEDPDEDEDDEDEDG